MTKQELRQLYYLNREIMSRTEELVNLKIKMQNSNGRISKESVSEYEKKLILQIKECKALKRRIEAFISGIEDSFTRQIFYYRYARCMSWKKVAYMTGGYNSEDGVRKIAERYLSSQKERKE